MESTTKAPERRTQRPPALDAATLCEAFQTTAEANPDRVALRTKGDEFSCTWAEYAERARRVAAGLASLGVEHGDTVALMLTNRPEFHIADAGAMHLGATCYSIYNTYTPEQIEYLVGDAGNRVIFTEQAFLDRLQPIDGLEHIVVVDGDAPEGGMTLAELEETGRRGLRLRGRVARRQARRPADADLHLGYHRTAQGSPAHSREPRRDGPLLRPGHRLPGRRQGRLLPADGARGRAQREPLPADAARLHGHLLPRPAPGDRLHARGQADLVLRGPAHLGEAEGRPGGDARRARGRAAEGGHQGRPGRRPAPHQGDSGRRRGAGRARAAVGEGRRRGAHAGCAPCSAWTRSRPATSARLRHRPR